jgi:hypothetical protein
MLLLYCKNESEHQEKFRIKLSCDSTLEMPIFHPAYLWTRVWFLPCVCVTQVHQKTKLYTACASKLSTFDPRSAACDYVYQENTCILL